MSMAVPFNINPYAGLRVQEFEQPSHGREVPGRADGEDAAVVDFREGEGCEVQEGRVGYVDETAWDFLVSE